MTLISDSIAGVADRLLEGAAWAAVGIVAFLGWVALVLLLDRWGWI